MSLTLDINKKEPFHFPEREHVNLLVPLDNYLYAELEAFSGSVPLMQHRWDTHWSEKDLA